MAFLEGGMWLDILLATFLVGLIYMAAMIIALLSNHIRRNRKQEHQ